MKYPKIDERISTLEAYDRDGSLSHAGAEELAELKKALRSIELLTSMVAGSVASGVDKEFLKQIRGIEISLWKSQVATVVDMQEDWMVFDSDNIWKEERAEELDGLIHVLGIITDFIDPIKTEEE